MILFINSVELYIILRLWTYSFTAHAQISHVGGAAKFANRLIQKSDVHFMPATTHDHGAMDLPKLLLLVFLAVHPSSSFFSEDVRGGTLDVYTLSENTVDGSFTDLASGRGVRFVSNLDSLFITTLDGHPLLMAEESDGSLRLVNIGGRRFIQRRKTERCSVDYAVPDTVEKADSRILEALVRRIETTDTNAHAQSFQSAVDNLFLRPESELMERAAFALGDEGITGREYPGVLPFYMAALQLQKKMDKDTSQEAQVKWRLKRDESCLSECPPCPDDECLGLCGYSCNCWKFICGDCCYHLGCYGHDVCCRENFTHSSCLFPFGFTCEGTYSCS